MLLWLLVSIGANLDTRVGCFADRRNIPLEPTNKVQEAIIYHALGSYDALHIATMEDWDIHDIVAFDWGIDELPKYTSCFVWTCGAEERKEKSLKLRREELQVIQSQSESDIVIQEAQDIVESETTQELEEPGNPAT